jgi:hypothetical protein
MDRETRAQAITILLGAAESTTEINALIRVGRRAGYLWRCPDCKTDRYANADTCCGKPRPVGDTDDDPAPA